MPYGRGGGMPSSAVTSLPPLGESASIPLTSIVPVYNSDTGAMQGVPLASLLGAGGASGGADLSSALAMNYFFDAIDHTRSALQLDDMGVDAMRDTTGIDSAVSGGYKFDSVNHGIAPASLLSRMSVFFRFEESVATNLTDSSTNNDINIGWQNTAATINATGKYGKCRTFGNQGTAVNYNTSRVARVANDKYTFCAWIKPNTALNGSYTEMVLSSNSNQSDNYLSDVGIRWLLLRPGTNASTQVKLAFRCTGATGGDFGTPADTFVCPTDIDLNVWTHVACTFDSSSKSVTLYINGTGTTYTYAAMPVDFGHRWLAAANHANFNVPPFVSSFYGDMDDVVWQKDDCFSPADIAAIRDNDDLSSGVMNVQTKTIHATSVPDDVAVLLVCGNSTDTAINWSDLTVSVTRDEGNSWETVALAEYATVGTKHVGTGIADVGDQPNDTRVRLKVEGDADFKVYGIALVW